jgi:hypothetical protein
MLMPKPRSNALIPLIGLLAAACSGDDLALGAGAGRARPDAAGGVTVGAADAGANAGLIAAGSSSPSSAGSAANAPGPSAQSCAKKTAKAMLQPVYLAFAFDVSGSMGKGDKPWHDRKLKWDPVVAATKSFLEDAKSDGLSASMTFFPADGGESTRCDADSYRKPDVAMQALPSQKFADAIDAIGMQDWRGGTPTLFVVEGVFDQIAQARSGNSGRYALVLVTDGYPQDCDDDEIGSVAKLVKMHAADTPTYVIGVTNPPLPDAPDVTTNLSEVAKAGGTEKAYLINTGNPTETVADFKTTIENIRGASLSCNLPIPAPPAGQSFDKKKVSVKYTSGSHVSPLNYAADCTAADGWHYDDPSAPKEIVLCPERCRSVQADANAELSVDFECEEVIVELL